MIVGNGGAGAAGRRGPVGGKAAGGFIAEAQALWKRFGELDVVQDVSFAVRSGGILGMVGPNGAGKTTTIRMLLDIIQPDQGRVLLFGSPFAHEHRALLGYLPEERGLYRDLRVMETLEYLGRLTGMKPTDARRRAQEVLSRLGMSEHREKKIKELSRGMGQLIQLAATIMHRPELLVLDEPFSGLDPVNLRLVKEVLGELRREGVAIILSTHQMNQVEELCDQVLMIDQGRVVLSGAVDEVRTGFGKGSIVVKGDGIPAGLPGVLEVNDHGAYKELVMSDGASATAVFRALADRNVEVRRFQVSAMPLEEIFIQVVGRTRE